jgi:hypothetical protein
MPTAKTRYITFLAIVVAVGLAACLLAAALWATDAQAKKDASVPKGKVKPPRAEGCPTGGCHLFGPPKTYGAGQAPSFVRTADFNKDGHADLVVVNRVIDFVDGEGVFVLLGRGDGTFQEAVGYRAPEGANSVVIADFFGDDGNPDLILNNRSFYAGQGDGTLRGPGALSGVNISGRSLTTADFNRDGKPDLAHTLPYDPLAIRDTDRVAVLWGTGTLTFEKTHSPWVYPGLEAVYIKAADFNGDGVPDLATVNELTRDVTVLLANRDGTFPQDDGSPGPQPGVYGAGSSPDELAAADFTVGSGGAADLVATDQNSDSVSFLENKGDGTFKGAVQIPAVPGARSPLAADFDGDKTPDLAVAYGNKVAVLLRAGGTFRAPDSYVAGQNASSLATADFNEDGKPDLAVAFEGSSPVGAKGGGVAVLLNTAGAPPVGDAGCNIVGGGGKDVLTGTPADETICGSGGKDAIDGGGGDDKLVGGNGNDTLSAEDGTGGDTLVGGNGKDICEADAGDTEQGC